MTGEKDRKLEGLGEEGERGCRCTLNDRDVRGRKRR